MSDDANAPDPVGEQPDPSQAAGAPTPDAAAAGAGGAAMGGAAATAAGEPESEGPSTAMIVAIVVVVLALLGVLAWLLFGSDDGDDISSVTIVSGSTIDVSVPTTVPETTVPATTVPETTAPPTTAPATTAPPTTAPATTAPPATTTPPTEPTTPPTSVPDIVVPGDDSTLADIVAASPDLSTLSGLLVEAGLDDDLAGDGPFTLFAPTDEAFELLGSAPEGDELVQLLLRHVAGEGLDSTAVLGRPDLTMLSNDVLVIDADDQTIDGALLILVDTEGTNGFLHVVDAVLIPQPTG